MPQRPPQIFRSSEFINDYFDQIRNKIVQDINDKSDNEILNIPADAYAESLASEYQLYPAELQENRISISQRQEDVPREQFPPEFSVMNTTVKKPVIIFHLPYQPGDNIFFKFLYPSTAARLQHYNSEIRLEYIDFHGKQDLIQSKFDNDLVTLRFAFTRLTYQFTQFNASLKTFALKEINIRKEKVLRDTNYLASFNIPLKDNDTTPKTFSIPEPRLREKIVITTPASSNLSSKPEPTLSYSHYQKILQYIDVMGMNFERYPELYEGKDEMALRDHILFGLDPHFEMGSASGETFNKIGKTDINLRHDSKVVFIAECKFWHGIKEFHETIDQLLSYLTWRDSKTAIILFIRNKEFTSVINTIKTDISTHPQYMRPAQQRAENWLEYTFSLPDDPERELHLSILAFHIPTTPKEK